MNEVERLIVEYRPTEAAIELVRKADIALLVGISGAGKDTIKKRLLEHLPFSDIVSHTTRPPRLNNDRSEIDGVDYHFISLEQAEQMLRKHEFIEAKFVHGTVYGTSVAELQRIFEAGQLAITDIDVQGVHEYKVLSNNVTALFLLPPNYNEWRRRLKARYATDEEFEQVWPKRYQSAIYELKRALEVPYYHFVINDNIDETTQTVREIVLRPDACNRRDDEARAAAQRLLDDLLRKR